MHADPTRAAGPACARTACVTWRCRLSSGQSPSPSCFTHPVPELDSPKRLWPNIVVRSTIFAMTGSESMDSYDADCSPDTPTFAEHCATVDEQLFNSISYNQNHVLYSLLPPSSTASQNYHLRPRAHSQQLPQHRLTGHLTNSNFITRMLFTDIY